MLALKVIKISPKPLNLNMFQNNFVINLSQRTNFTKLIPSTLETYNRKVTNFTKRRSLLKLSLFRKRFAIMPLFVYFCHKELKASQTPTFDVPIAMNITRIYGKYQY